MEVKAHGPAAEITQLAELSYGLLRNKLLPPGGISQEGAFTALLYKQAHFYGGDGFVAAVSREAPLVLEFLGDPDRIPGFLQRLQMQKASVRIPGGSATTVYLDLTGQEQLPSYFGLPMD